MIPKEGDLIKIYGTTSRNMYFCLIDKLVSNTRIYTKAFLSYNTDNDSCDFYPRNKKDEFFYLISDLNRVKIKLMSMQEKKIYMYCKKHPNLNPNTILNLYNIKLNV